MCIQLSDRAHFNSASLKHGYRSQSQRRHCPSCWETCSFKAPGTWDQSENSNNRSTHWIGTLISCDANAFGLRRNFRLPLVYLPMVDTFQTEPETRPPVTTRHIIRHLPWKYGGFHYRLSNSVLTSIQGNCRSIGTLRPSIHTLFVSSTLRNQHDIRCGRWRWPCTICGRT